MLISIMDLHSNSRLLLGILNSDQCKRSIYFLEMIGHLYIKKISSYYLTFYAQAKSFKRVSFLLSEQIYFAALKAKIDLRGLSNFFLLNNFLWIPTANKRSANTAFATLL